MGLIDFLSDLVASGGADEFECNDCGNSFTRLVGPGETPTCPACDSFDVDRG
ncbi:MAG: zinc ribbon domain-containing protein [Haloferacaceae archaeon]